MPVYVYIIYSQKHHYYYKGSTADVIRRLVDHNSGRNASTSRKGPWQLVFVRTFNNVQDALKEEHRLKRTNTRYIEWLIQQSFNEILNFI